MQVSVSLSYCGNKMGDNVVSLFLCPQELGSVCKTTTPSPPPTQKTGHAGEKKIEHHTPRGQEKRVSVPPHPEPVTEAPGQPPSTEAIALFLLGH